MWAISASPILFTSPIMNCSAAPAPPAPSCNVTLKAQHSTTACTLGKSYGCWAENQTMWTSGGCRGEFTCDGTDVVCDVDGNGVHSCPCGPAANVTCVPWISDVQREVLFNAEVIAVNQDVTPQGRPLVDGNLAVWARHLSDGSVAVALYNENDATASLSVSFAALGWPSGTTATARDLWAHADLGSFTDNYPATGGVSVAPHETHVVRLTPK